MSRYKAPWEYRPAHVIVHLCILVGVLLWILDNRPGHLMGIPDIAYHIWVTLGLISFPLIGISYYMIFMGGGMRRYIASWIHLIANIMGFYVIGIHLYACWAAHFIDWHEQTFFPYVFLIGTEVFLLWLIGSGIIRLITLEKLATDLQISERDSSGASSSS